MVGKNKRHSRRAAFTLMEVLLVMVILVALGALAVNVFMGTQKKADINTSKIQVGAISDACERYQFDVRELPPSFDALRQDPGLASGAWGGPYLGADVGLDPWNNPYQYAPEGTRNNGEKPDVWSMGPDKTDGTADDIGNWQ